MTDTPITHDLELQSRLSTSTLEPASTPDPNDPAYRLALTVVEAADDRKGDDIVLIEVGAVSVLADYFVVITGFSKAQVRAIARNIEEKAEETCQRRPVRIEGQSEGSWVLQDFGEVIVHIMLPQEREFYDLEAFWGHAPRLTLAASA